MPHIKLLWSQSGHLDLLYSQEWVKVIFLHLWPQKIYTGRAFRFGTLWPISGSYPRHSQLTEHSLMLANGCIRQSDCSCSEKLWLSISFIISVWSISILTRNVWLWRFNYFLKSFVHIVSFCFSAEVCDLNCLHGVCTDQRCVCEEGWTGALCDQVECDRRCTQNGYCNNGTCVCKPGFNGRHCTLGKFWITLIFHFMKSLKHKSCVWNPCRNWFEINMPHLGAISRVFGLWG